MPAAASSQETERTFFLENQTPAQGYEVESWAAIGSLGSSRPEAISSPGVASAWHPLPTRSLAGSCTRQCHATHGGVLVSVQYGTHVCTILLHHS